MLPSVSGSHTFAGGLLDRVHASRQSAEFVAAQFARSDALFAVFFKLKPLLVTVRAAPADHPAALSAGASVGSVGGTVADMSVPSGASGSLSAAPTAAAAAVAAIPVKKQQHIVWCTLTQLREWIPAAKVALFLCDASPPPAAEPQLVLQCVLLGVRPDAVPLFAVDLAPLRLDSDRLGEGRFCDLRMSAALLPPADASLLAMARGLLAWNDRTRFCAGCGAAVRPSGGGTKRVCVRDGCVVRDHYPRVADPSVIVAVTSRAGDRCLLGRGARFPPGMYSCLAGFVEAGESLEEAVCREVLEEAGVRVDAGSIRYQSSQPWPFPGSLMIGFTARAADDRICVDRDELEDARWFTRDEVQQMLERSADVLSAEPRVPPATAIAHHLIRAWYEDASRQARL